MAGATLGVARFPKTRWPTLGRNMPEIVLLHKDREIGRYELGERELSIGRLEGAVLTEDPKPPRAAAPDRHIPIELERACLRTMVRDRAQRTSSAALLGEEIQSWLEAAADRDKRRELAEAQARVGCDLLDRHHELKAQVARIESEVAKTHGPYKGWQPVEEKLALYAAEDRLKQARKELAHAASQTVTALEKALAFEAENRGARESLADYYWELFQEPSRRATISSSTSTPIAWPRATPGVGGLQRPQAGPPMVWRAV